LFWGVFGGQTEPVFSLSVQRLFQDYTTATYPAWSCCTSTLDRNFY